MKRFFDIVASGCGLLVLLPLFAVLAVWIKLDSREPKQQMRVLDIRLRITDMASICYRNENELLESVDDIDKYYVDVQL